MEKLPHLQMKGLRLRRSRHSRDRNDCPIYTDTHDSVCSHTVCVSSCMTTRVLLMYI